MAADIFLEIGLMIIVATFGAYLAGILRQPILPAYILGGAILGPGLGLITSSTLIGKLSEIGIAFLLFIVGLELSFRRLRDIGLISSVGGTIQVLLLFIVGYFIADLLGFSAIESVYLGLVIVFSSTLIVVKLLSDKKELDTLHGRVVIGVLIMQDLLAIFALSALTTNNGLTWVGSVLSLVKGLLIIVLAIVSAKYVFPVVFRFAAKSRELLLMVSLSACFIFSILFQLAGFSIVIGAFVAGVALANLPYNLQIVGRVKSLRDFFVALFFTSLGLQLSFNVSPTIIFPLVLFTFIVIFIKPAVIMFTCALFGYTKRTSLLSSLSLAQISEFSLIIVAQGMLVGHISREIFTITILLAIITMSASTYFIKFDDQIYKRLSKYLDAIKFMNVANMEYLPQEKHIKHDIILCGYDRIGYSIFKTLAKMGKTFLVVDFNPDVIKNLISHKIPCIYGDLSDDEIQDRIGLSKAKLIVSTVTNFDDNLSLLKAARKENEDATVFVTANKINDALELYGKGADYVILPHFLGGDRVSSLLVENAENLRGVSKHRESHIDELKHRLTFGHEHPNPDQH